MFGADNASADGQGRETATRNLMDEASWQTGTNKDPEPCWHWQEGQAAFPFTSSFL